MGDIGEIKRRRGGRGAPLSRPLAPALGPRPSPEPKPDHSHPWPQPRPLARLDEMAVNYEDIESDRPALEDRLMGQYSAERQREIELEEEEYYDEYEPQSWSSWAFGYCSIL